MNEVTKKISFFIIIVSFLLGGVVHALFFGSSTVDKFSLISVSSQKDCTSCNELISSQIVEKVITKEIIKYVPTIKIVYKTKEKKDVNSSEDDLFLIALNKDKFSDAMTYYEEADEEKHSLYQTALVGYFDKIQRKEPEKAVEQMQYFIEIESQSKIIVFQLAQLFQNRGDYREALNLLVEFSYAASYNEKNIINTKVKSISLSYIKQQKVANNFENLIDFLTDRMNIGFLSDFYSFELAKVYFKLKKYMKAIELLEILKYSEVYKERAIELLTFIQNKLEEQEEYPVQIPLIRRGLHFMVKVYANQVPLLLMIDTGASTTTVDGNKIYNFTVLKDNVKFHTAGGVIYNTIYSADTFTVDSISLNNFRISGTEFSGNNMDGLLGMNFLGRFKFKIDQKEAILFLGKKNVF